jgi:hypothetical protein
MDIKVKPPVLKLQENRRTMHRNLRQVALGVRPVLFGFVSTAERRASLKCKT